MNDGHSPQIMKRQNTLGTRIIQPNDNTALIYQRYYCQPNRSILQLAQHVWAVTTLGLEQEMSENCEFKRVFYNNSFIRNRFTALQRI